MKSYVTFTRKGLSAMLAAMIAVILICCKIYAVSNMGFNASTNAKRLEFIRNTGYEVLSNEPETKTVAIPEDFSDVYKNYNKLQRSAGYDLSNYKGCDVVIYTYKIKTPSGYDGDCVFNMMVYNNRVIGGDVSSSALGGFMLSIKNQSE